MSKYKYTHFDFSKICIDLLQDADHYLSNFISESLERERDDLRETVGVEKKLHQHRVAELEDTLAEIQSDHSQQVDTYSEQIQELQYQYESAQNKIKNNQQFLEVSDECLINPFHLSNCFDTIQWLIRY